jgi:glucokinase
VPADAGVPAVIGVDLGGTKCHAVLAGEDGAVLRELRRSTRELPDPADVLLAVVAELRASAGSAGRCARAVALGIPAFLDPRSGLVVGGNNLGWHGFDLRARLDAALPEPYLVENDVNLAALGEASSGAGRGASSCVTVSLGTGLGGAVVVGGRLLRGHHGAAGELGFLLADRGQLGRPGMLGMEERVGGLAVAERAQQLARCDPRAADLAAVDAAGVFAAARSGHPVARQLVDELLDHVAMTIADVAAVLDPERVVLDGGLGRALVPFLPRLREQVSASVLYAPDIAVSALVPTAALAGAVGEAWRLARGSRAAEGSR